MAGHCSTDNGPADPTFYITEDGVVFESGQYVLQSYAVGIVDFEIPAADFGDDLTADIFLMEYRMLAGIFAKYRTLHGRAPCI